LVEEMADPSSAISPRGGIFAGAGLFVEALRMLRRQRNLWGLAAVPVAVAMGTVSLALGLFYANAGEIYAFVTGWLPVIEVTEWYRWIWLGPAKVVLTGLGYLLFLAAAGIAVVVAYLAATAISAPFLDALSRRVEAIEAGDILESEESGWRALIAEGRRAIAGELQRTFSFFALWLAIFGVGVIVPGAQLIASPALLLLTIVFIPLDYAGYTLDRRQVPFRERRVWLRANLKLMLGFGSIGFLSGLVPGLNFVLIPALVVGGTLLVLRHPPSRVAGERG
jgi:CysZ protein